MRWDNSLSIGDREVAIDRPTYFIADIGSNHEGDLERAKALIHLAAQAGADCAKFQHFRASDIVSDAGFRALGGQLAHQARWSRSVYEVFQQYETPRDWTRDLAAECAAAGVDFMTTPYDVAAADSISPFVKAFKIGSGDIAWPALIRHVAAKGKPVILSTGAADMVDVERAAAAALEINPQLCVMQCNTNYTGSLENFAHVNLNVLRAYALKWPGLVLGLSDHAPGHAAVLGAIALGARTIEKHFTDDTTRDGPDHPFAMDPMTWRDMVDRARELEMALGDGVKRVEPNEVESAVVQRRALRLTADRPAGHVLAPNDVVALRPRPYDSVEPVDQHLVIGAPLLHAKRAGEALMWADVEEAAPARAAVAAA